MVVWLVAIMAVLLTGCGKRSETPANATTAQGRQELSQSQATPDANPQVNPAADSAATEAQMAATLGELTQALRRWVFEHRRAPKSFEEFAASASVPIPAAPPGKKFAIQPKRMEVILVKR